MNPKTVKLGSMDLEVDGRHLGSFDMLKVPSSEVASGPVFSIANKDLMEVRFKRLPVSTADGVTVETFAETLAETLAKMQSEADAIPPLKCPVCGKEYKPAGQNWTVKFEQWTHATIGQVVLCSVDCVMLLAVRVKDACSAIATREAICSAEKEPTP